MQYVGFLRCKGSTISWKDSFISFWWYTWRHLYLDLLFSVGYRGIETNMISWICSSNSPLIVFIFYKESKCTFSKKYISEICPLVSIICNIPAYIRIFTCSEFLSTILIITNEWSSEAEKMSTNRFCLLISRLFSCSVIGIALKVPLNSIIASYSCAI
jgi:hypothetical protein